MLNGMETSPRRLTDEQLAVTRLEIEDPLAVSHLSFERPPADLPPEIIGEYHLPTSGNPIWCCHCQAHRHWNGFVITNGTGTKYLIGSACGPNHYELSFQFAANQHRTLTRRKAVLDRLQTICAAADAIERTCHDMLHSEPLALIDRKREELRRASESAYGLLATAVQNESPLIETISLRDLERERRRDEQRRGDQKGPPIYVQENRSIGMISGAGLIRRHGDCRDRLMALRAAVQEAVAIRRKGTDEASLHQLTKVVRGAEESWAAAEAAIVEAVAAPSFFSAENLDRLARWSSTHRHFHFQADGSALLVSGDSIKTTMIAPLPAIRLGRLPAMQEGR
jgi:hypothetical protein